MGNYSLWARFLQHGREAFDSLMQWDFDTSPCILDLVNATITCPNCEHQSLELIPQDACLFFYECPNCKTLLKPLAGDCCVFCSYADHDCPSSKG